MNYTKEGRRLERAQSSALVSSGWFFRKLSVVSEVLQLVLSYK